MKYFIIILLTFTGPVSAVPTDSLVFKNGNKIDGEIKSMDRGVVIVKTKYSDSDFKIEWRKIDYISTNTRFSIALSNLSQYWGRLKTISGDTVGIYATTILITTCNINDIVYLDQVQKDFQDRIFVSLDLGGSTTKANNLRQASSRSTFGYRAEKWAIGASFNTIKSTQDGVEPIDKSDGALNYKFVLPRRRYALATVSIESNTEQKLETRLNAQLGLGQYLMRSNYMYWGAILGLNRNVETYTSETPDRFSWEGYLGMDLNMFDMGDVDILTSIVAYPGITAKDRLRADYQLDFKYDLAYDFYIKLGGTINYDNKPAENASKTDYVAQLGFGWEWD